MPTTKPRAKRRNLDHISRTELCRRLNVSIPTITNLLARGMPVIRTADRDKGTPWVFSWSDVQDWLKDQEESGPSVTNEHPDILRQKLRKLTLEADRLEHRLGIEKENTIAYEEIFDTIEPWLRNIVIVLEALPRRLGSFLDEDQRRLVEKHITDTINGLPTILAAFNNEKNE
jgi:transcriptional regulator with XRE-family HTH domain